jgi:hypothetical protein
MQISLLAAVVASLLAALGLRHSREKSTCCTADVSRKHTACCPAPAAGPAPRLAHARHSCTAARSSAGRLRRRRQPRRWHRPVLEPGTVRTSLLAPVEQECRAAGRDRREGQRSSPQPPSTSSAAEPAPCKAAAAAEGPPGTATQEGPPAAGASGGEWHLLPRSGLVPQPGMFEGLQPHLVQGCRWAGPACLVARQPCCRPQLIDTLAVVWRAAAAPPAPAAHQQPLLGVQEWHSTGCITIAKSNLLSISLPWRAGGGGEDPQLLQGSSSSSRSTPHPPALQPPCTPAATPAAPRPSTTASAARRQAHRSSAPRRRAAG